MGAFNFVAASARRRNPRPPISTFERQTPMRKLIATATALLLTAGCSGSPTVPGAQERVNDVRPSYDGLFGGSGNVVEGGETSGGAVTADNTTTTTGTEITGSDTTRTGRGGFGAGSGN